MAARKKQTAEVVTERSASEIVHDALESLRTKLSHLLGDKEHNVLETIKYAAGKVIHKAEKVLEPKALKKSAKKAIKSAEKALKSEKVESSKPASKAPRKSASRKKTAARPRKKAVGSRSKKAPAKKSR